MVGELDETLNPRCIIGLGNPGTEYEKTRHNIGFMVIDALAERHRCKLKPSKGEFAMRVRFKASSNDVLLVKPTTYMNRSGIAAKEIVEQEGLSPQEIFVVLDDFELPFGQLRIRKSGSAGSHNGLESIIYHLGTEDFPRLRIGIGAPPEGKDPADYVLSRFSKAEAKELEFIIATAAQAVETAISNGVEAAMNRFNRGI